MTTIIKNATIVNEGASFTGGVVIENEIIKTVFRGEPVLEISGTVIDAKGKLLMPGVIDDQVHFREPGATQKADMLSESRAAVAGGVTSFMDMPNNTPPTTTLDLLERKYERAAATSLANYSFYLGATNENIKEIQRINPGNICGVKVFMGSSTGNMLVDDEKALSAIFAESPVLIATHCEDEATIKNNLQKFQAQYGENIPVSCHPLIRSEEACVRSTDKAITLAGRYHSRLHVLHLSTAIETTLFSPAQRITAEVCAHHLWFCDEDYEQFGNLIKCNPAIKTANNRKALRDAVNSGKISVVASDHAPHLLEEKKAIYLKAPSGLPLVQHTLPMMLELCKQGIFSHELVAERMCHAPARLYGIEKRGFIREGYFADLVLVDTQQAWTVDKSTIFYKCGWSPLERQTFHSKITHTFVNGRLVYENGIVFEEKKGQRLLFKK